MNTFAWTVTGFACVFGMVEFIGQALGAKAGFTIEALAEVVRGALRIIFFKWW